MIPEQGEGARPARVGPYRLESRLGSGGMGAVWRAWDERLKRPVAVKQIRPDRLDHPGARARLRHEAAAGARLNHPAIVHIYDILEAGEVEWIVMELVEGETLKEILARGPLDVRTAVRLGREIAKGLAKAHSQGIVHRDLKAANIMVTPSGHAKILDFGIAKWVSSPAADDDSTSSRSGILGTPHAMSPEQAMGQTVDARSDLFSFGTLLYEMLTGVSPFRADTQTATLARVCTHRPPPVRQLRPEVSPELSELAGWLLEKEPHLRPQEAKEVAAVLNAILARQALDEPAPVRPFIPRRRKTDPSEEETVLDKGRPDCESLRLMDGERRQVTVLCCGLVESAGPGAWRSPDLERLSEVMPELRRLSEEVMARFGGTAGAGLGHVLWTCFGAPRAHGDDAQRAVRAARELVARVRDQGWPGRDGSRLALRAGVHSGPAVVPKESSRDRYSHERLALGTTLDVATGLQGLAPAEEVLVSDATRRLIARGFATERLPPERLPGTGESVPVFRLLAPLDAPPLALPLVGREGELDLLVQRWQLVQAGESQVVLISGEPGIGKSRLVGALREELGDLARRWMFFYGATHAQSTPFHAVVESLRRNFLRPARSPAGQLALLEETLRRYGLSVEDDLAVLAPLLSLPLPAGDSLAPLSPEALRRRTLETLFNLLLQITAEQPLVLVIEDLHWLDPSSLELVGLLLEGIGGVSILMVLTFRLDFELPWTYRSSWTQLRLSRLNRTEALEIVDRVPGGDRLPLPVRQQIVAKSDGVPLFVEELTKSLVETAEAAGANEAFGIPGLLRDSLTARLDRLGGAREVAQMAAVIGRSFSFELLAAVSSLDNAALLKALDRLVHAELLVRRGTGERSTYVFRHALLQEAACELLLPRNLERLHQTVAEALESRFPETAAGQPELVAHHYTQARRPERAIELWLQAGLAALKRFANREAREHFRKGLRLIESLPEGPERDRAELSLQVGSARAVILSRGHSDDEVEILFDRALHLGQRLGEIPNEFQFLLWSFYTWRADLRKAEAAALHVLRLARRRRDLEGSILGLQEIAILQLHRGHPRSALRFLRRAAALYPRDRPEAAPFFPGWDARHQNVCEAARALSLVGRPDLALRFARRGLYLAEGGHDPYGAAAAFQVLSCVHYARREYEEVQLHAQWMYDLCLKQGFAFFAAHGKFLLSLAGARLATPEEAVNLVGEALQALDTLRRDHRQELNLPEFLGWLAEACIACGMTSEARWLLEDAREIAARTGERLGQSELFRLHGALGLAEAEGTPTTETAREAETCFRMALHDAKASGSLWLELRAATDLARLLAKGGRAPQAREILGNVLERLSEGAETADLKAAAELYEALA